MITMIKLAGGDSKRIAQIFLMASKKVTSLAYLMRQSSGNLVASKGNLAFGKSTTRKWKKNRNNNNTEFLKEA